MCWYCETVGISIDTMNGIHALLLRFSVLLRAIRVIVIKAYFLGLCIATINFLGRRLN